MNIRIGFGFDVHALKKGQAFTIGGVVLEHHSGAFGHSDADVLVHAICDALLGAAGLRDIGVHFSDKDARWKGISSLILLEHVCGLLEENGFEIGNIDSTLCLEAPRINPHVLQMQENIARVCKVEASEVSIKATTNEQLGFIGREEGVAAYAVCLISKTNTKTGKIEN